MDVRTGVVEEKSVIAEFQRRFPREFEIVVQHVYIQQLEARNKELEESVGNELPE